MSAVVGGAGMKGARADCGGGAACLVHLCHLFDLTLLHPAASRPPLTRAPLNRRVRVCCWLFHSAICFGGGGGGGRGGVFYSPLSPNNQTRHEHVRRSPRKCCKSVVEENASLLSSMGKS